MTDKRSTSADFVTAFNANGSKPLFSTYLGGKGYDDATGIAASRLPAIAGYTSVREA